MKTDPNAVMKKSPIVTEALKFLQYSVDLYGISAGTAYNMGVCCYYLGELEQAFGYVQQALELEPVFDAANVLWAELSEVPQTVVIRKRG
jgi:tetratricopeptide (TPR) repeat protein